jgi:hypothetical protein
MSFKEQLKTEILPKTVDYYNSGMDINSAIVKAAEDFKLNLDQTDRLLETMNTARVIAHYEKNASDRTANCDIADKDTVRKLLYGDKPQEKKASASSGANWGDYAGYFDVEHSYRKGNLEKAASAECGWGTEPAPKEFTVKQAADHAMDYVRKVEGQRKFAEERLGIAKEDIAQRLSKIAHVLSSGYEPEARYAIFKAACIRSCPAVVKSVDSEIPKQIIKDAAPHFRVINRANVIDTSAVSSLLKAAGEIEGDLKKVAQMQSILDTLRKREQSTKAVIRKYAQAVQIKKAANGPFGNRGGGSSPSKDEDDEDKKGKKDKSKEDPWLGSAAKTLSGSLPETPGTVKAIHGYLTGSALSPEKIDEIMSAKQSKGTSLKDYVNNLRRSAIITELYNDDPVLSEATRDDVMRAYATLIQTAPEASLNKEVVRAILRQSVNSVAVSPFDAKQWADLDTTLLKNKGARFVVQ